MLPAWDVVYVNYDSLLVCALLSELQVIYPSDDAVGVVYVFACPCSVHCYLLGGCLGEFRSRKSSFAPIFVNQTCTASRTLAL